MGAHGGRIVNRMNAEEARKLTHENLQGPVIEPHLKRIYGLIEDAARKGKLSIENPLYGMLSGLQPGAEKAIRERLADEGYRFVHVPDADPGHPCRRSYDLISWGDA